MSKQTKTHKLKNLRNETSMVSVVSTFSCAHKHAEWLRVWLAEPPTPRGLDNISVAGLDLDATTMTHTYDLTIGSHKVVLAHLAWLASLEAEGSDDTTIRKHRDGEWRVEHDVSLDPVTATEAARTARATADRERLDGEREAELENLGVGEPRVGHVRVHRVTSVVVGTGARPPTDRFVVVDTSGVAKSKVVHGAW